MKKKQYVIIANIVIIIAVIGYAMFYSFSQRSRSLKSSEATFTKTVEVMEQVAANYLANNQEACAAWQKYLNSRQLTMEAAMAELKELNSDGQVSIQLLRCADLKGIASEGHSTDPQDHTVQYGDEYTTLYERLKYFAQGGLSEQGINVTRDFSNPVDGRFVIAFCSGVRLYDDRGNGYDALLLRLVSRDAIKASWVFPVGYSDAQVAMIDTDGSYLIRSNTLKSESFFEFLRIYNQLSYQESDQLAEQLRDSSFGGMEYLDAGRKKTYYAYAHIAGNEEWLIIGSIPVASLEVQNVQWSLLAVICLAFLALIGLDGHYFIDLNQQLRRSLEEAKKANQAKTNFLSTMSHDIRTPMNAIVGMTAIARHAIDDRQQVTDCLDKISLASDQLLTLINDILDISRVESGKISLNPVPFSLAQLVHGLVSIMYPLVHDKGIELRFRLRDISQERLDADELRINQIWINILSNAVKYTNTGGRITVEVWEEPAPDDPKQVWLGYRVADTGIGMAPEFLKKIYDPFSRAQDARIDNIQGSGLGMAIVKQMTDLLGGKIEAASELGKGTVFTVRLPIRFATVPEPAKPASGKRALVAAIDADCRRVMTDALAELGLAAQSCGTSKELTAALAEGADLLIIDQQLAEDGIWERIGRGGSRPAIWVAAYDPSAVRETMQSQGASGCLAAPVFPSDLRRLISELAAGRTGTAPEAPDQQLANWRILVAEDNDLNWEVTRRLLGFYGIKSERAANGRSCFEMIQLHAPGYYQLVLMDIHMPVMNGYEATAAIRGLPFPAKAGIPIIAMTADAFAEDIANCAKAGMNGHISKPIKASELLAKLESYAIKTGGR